MPEPPGQIRSRRTRTLHTHQVQIPSLSFFSSLTPFDPFFLPPSLPLTLHLSLSLLFFMLSSFPPLCLMPLLPHLHHSPCIVILITHPLHPLFPIFITFQPIPVHSIPFHSKPSHSIPFHSVPGIYREVRKRVLCSWSSHSWPLTSSS